VLDNALLIARLLLVLVFAVAGASKLADRAGCRRAVTDFGMPASLAAPLANLLPLAELAVAAALIPPSTAWWGALGALALLLLFVAGISLNLAHGHQPNCHCFGQLHSARARPLRRKPQASGVEQIETLVSQGAEGQLAR
jgi:uncharacterized membrane protein YphA (DoxX/SURF4 family)